MNVKGRGTTVYLSGADIEALEHAQDHLSTQLESAGVEVAELSQALAGVYAILHKASQARKKRTRGQMIAKAVKAAEAM